MSQIYDEFIKYLDAEDKEKSVEFILNKLSNSDLTVIQVYTELLEPSLNVPFCIEGDEACIWKEHTRTNIIRTIVENCYPFVIKEIKEKSISKLGKKVLIASPIDEYHDLGARIIADFFTLSGFDVILIGANTPREEIGSAVKICKPDIVALSVTNYFHLVESENVIKTIKKEYGFAGKIIVGGNAFYNNPEFYKKIGADYMLKTFEDIKKLAEEI